MTQALREARLEQDLENSRDLLKEEKETIPALTDQLAKARKRQC